MSETTVIGSWQGGRLRVFAPLGPQLLEVNDADATPRRQLEHDYRPVGNGWAIRADMSPVALEIDSRAGIELDFDVREGSLECVAIRSIDGGPPLTASLLRRIEATIASTARDCWAQNVVRLREHNGEVVAVLPGPSEPETPGAAVQFGANSSDVEREYSTRPRRQPRTEERLARILELWEEAGHRRERSKARYVAAVLHLEPGTVRNLVAAARKQERLQAAKSATTKKKGT